MTSWSILLQDVKHQELVALLTELISAAEAIEARNRVLELARGLHPSPDPTKTTKPTLEKQLARAGKEGIGCALIITVSNLVQSVCIPNGSQSKEWSLYERGPKIGDAHWAAAIMAASNYVRHGEEWRFKIDKHGFYEQAGWKVIQNSRSADELEAGLSFLPKDSRGNIATLARVDFQFSELLYAGPSYWRVAELVRLNDMVTTVGNFSELMIALNNHA